MDIGDGGAQRHPQADLRPPLAHEGGDDGVEPDRQQRERDGREHGD